MPLVCIQCSMRAMVKGEPPPSFEETVEAHMARLHPDPVATLRERQEMEKAMWERLGGRIDDDENRGA